MAGTKRTDRSPATPGAAPSAPIAEAPDDVTAPIATVHRSRLAFAMSATVAALPILVLDNFPATADTGERTGVHATADAAPLVSDAPATTITVDRTERSTPTTAAPTTSTTAGVALAEDDLAGDGAQTATAVQAVQAPEPAAAARPRSVAAPTPTTAPPPPPTASPARPGDPDDPATWDRLAQCETGGRWHLNSGNGYYGGLQFSLATWRDVGGVGYPHEASREEQIRRGRMLQQRYGWGQWPSCSRELGYR